MTTNDSSSEKSKKPRFCRRKKLPDSCTCTSSDDEIKSKEKPKKKKEKNHNQKDKKQNKKEHVRKEKLRKTKSDETAIRIPSKTTTGTTSGTQYSSADSDANAKKRKCCWVRKLPKRVPTRDTKQASEITDVVPLQEKKASKAVVVQDAKAGISLMFDPRYTCNPFYTPPAVTKDFRKARNIPPVVQPVIGVCTQGRCRGVGGTIRDSLNGAAVHEHPVSGGERLVEVRYALVRISVFPNYTTYEIMQSSKKKPKKVPDVVEGIFVTKR